MKRIAWKDIFKPRYALVVTLEKSPKFLGTDLRTAKFVDVPCVPTLPYKRPLTMSYNKFYNSLKDRYGMQSMIFCGHYWTFRMLDGIGSANKGNMNNAILMGDK